MKIIIAGSRTIKDRLTVDIAITESGFEISEVVSGLAPGPDQMGLDWAMERGIPAKLFRADWSKYGRSAGIVRNVEMGKCADGLIAIWNGKSPGTRHMIEYMNKLGKPIFIYRDE